MPRVQSNINQITQYKWQNNDFCFFYFHEQFQLLSPTLSALCAYKIVQPGPCWKFLSSSRIRLQYLF